MTTYRDFFQWNSDQLLAGLMNVIRYSLRITLGLLNCDFENNIWRHLLNILNDRIVEVLRFSVTLESRSKSTDRILFILW